MLKVDRKGGIAVVVLKYMKVLSAFIIIVALCFVNNVKAEISEDEYAELREIFSEARLSIMSDAEKEELVNGNLTINEKIYQVTKTVNDTYTYSEIDSDLYETLMDNYNNGITTMDAYHETSYKSCPARTESRTAPRTRTGAQAGKSPLRDTDGHQKPLPPDTARSPGSTWV